jgi:hypothetical protein
MAERVNVNRHVATYRITRTGATGMIQTGASAETILNTLEKGSQNPVPQNIAFQIREWAESLNRIVIHRHMSLIEFPTTAERDQALTRNPTGTPVGNRFAILTDTLSHNGTGDVLYDYARPPARILTVNEEGVLTIQNPPDLFITTQLTPWATPVKPLVWKLNPGNSAPRQSGDLVGFLKSRSLNPPPPFLLTTVNAWNGDAPRLQLASVTVLRCANPETMNAIIRSDRLKPCIAGILAPQLLVIHTEQLDAFIHILQWAQFQIDPDLTIHPINT